MQDALPAPQQIELTLHDEPVAAGEKGNLFFRSDTILGICEGVGEEFGFNANYLRVALCVALYFSPVAVIAGYLALGVAFAVARWLYPRPRAAAAPQLAAQPAALTADNQSDDELLAA